MPSLFEVDEPRGRKVVCTEETWRVHVLGRHPEMEGQDSEVILTIRQPMFGIYQDAAWTDRNVYYRRVGRLYMKVIVAFDERALGALITAFLARDMKQGEQLIWPESNP